MAGFRRQSAGVGGFCCPSWGWRRWKLLQNSRGSVLVEVTGSLVARSSKGGWMADGVSVVQAKARVRQRCPNWYLAMREFQWTVANIRSKFDVPRAVARHIQSCHPTYEEACSIASAHVALIGQVGH